MTCPDTASQSTITGYRWQMTAAGEPLARAADELFEAGPGQAVVRVAGCGVCHTDLGFLYDGVATRLAAPIALGHEISGEVVAAGAGAQQWLGRAVIIPAVTPCGTCPDCASGMGAICTTQVMPGNDIQGGFASHVVVPAHGLCHVDVPGALSGEQLGTSGCNLAELSVIADAVTTPYQAIRRAGLQEGDFAIVVGLGGVGGFAVQIAAALGATVAGFDINPARLKSLENHGLSLGLDPSQSDPREIKKTVRAFAKEKGLPRTGWKIFECSGSGPGQELAFNLLGHGAHLSVVGFTMAKVNLRLSNLMAFHATAQGNWGCLPEYYPDVLQLVLDGRVNLKEFVETHPMDDIQEVMEDAHAQRLERRAVLMP
ncbi:MAG TPA: 6-hydroxycyclohex-1-ene-1-carbonyl-CoA dehydrogenase [Planctomycetota bacterium]|jgi:6-hydroxycyclohex-1-ene-1-carbonyl-CoA dehydrogenase|nr:6-hydroxycyclohex-1-ene-1-carbonyl-CoA dehydrogenase [Planctomycetota bacterium]